MITMHERHHQQTDRRTNVIFWQYCFMQ